MERDLVGIGAMVTGASSGIGAGIAHALAARGAHVACLARNQDRLRAVVTSIKEGGGNASSVAGDVTDVEFLERAIQDVEALGILVNNAAVNCPGPLLERSNAEIERMLAVNLGAVINATVFAARAMKKGGAGGVIVGISSTLGHVGGPGRAVYSASKHALEGFSKSIAVELAPYGIRAVTVAPTFVETEMTREQLSKPEYLEWAKSMIPMRELASVPDVVAAVDFLVSKSAQMVTGSSLIVDGGYTAQ